MNLNMGLNELGRVWMVLNGFGWMWMSLSEYMDLTNLGELDLHGFHWTCMAVIGFGFGWMRFNGFEWIWNTFERTWMFYHGSKFTLLVSVVWLVSNRACMGLTSIRMMLNTFESVWMDLAEFECIWMELERYSWKCLNSNEGEWIWKCKCTLQVYVSVLGYTYVLRICPQSQ